MRLSLRLIYFIFFAGSGICGPHNTTIQIVPDREYFDVNSLLQVKGVEVNGNLETWHPILIIDPKYNIVRDRGNLTTLVEEGTYSILAALPNFEKASRTIVVDDTAPTVTLTSPIRGTCVEPGRYDSIEGKLTDEHSGADFVEINEVSEDLSASGKYSKDAQFRHGLNYVNVVGHDRAGLSTLKTAQFYQTGEWIDFDPNEPLESIKNGAINWWVSRNIFDRFEGAVENTNSLSHFLSSALGYLNLGELAENPKVLMDQSDPLSKVATISTLVRLSSAKLYNPIVDVEPANGGFFIHGGFYGINGVPALTMEIEVEASVLFLTYFYMPLAKFKATFRMDSLGIQTDVRAAKSSGEDLELRIENLYLDKGNVEIRIKLSEDEPPILPWPFSGMFMGPTAYLEWLGSRALTIEGQDLYDHYESDIRFQVQNHVNAILEDLAGSFKSQLDFSTDTFPWAASSTTITLRSALDSLDISEAGVEIGMNTGFKSDGTSAHESLPIFTRNSCDLHTVTEKEDGVDRDYNLAVRVHVDMLNQLAHAIWRGGVFDFHLTPSSFSNFKLEEFGITNFDARTFFGLPAIVNDCDGGAIKVEVGGAEIRAAFDAFERHFDATFLVSGMAELEVSVEENKIRFWLAGASLHSFETKIVHEGAPSDKRLFETLVEHYMMELLEDEFKGVFLGEFALPSFELDQIDSNIPFDQVFTFNGLDLVHGNGYFYLNAQLEDPTY